MTLRPFLTLAFGLALLGSAAGAADDPRAVAANIMQAYVTAWNGADAHALGAQFAADGDFINPTGYYARGPAAVEAFYHAAFTRGYAGSRGGFMVKSVRVLTKDVVTVDGLWSIDGARAPGGPAMAPERGIATAVIVRRAGVWRVALLREQSSAATLDIPADR